MCHTAVMSGFAHQQTSWIVQPLLCRYWANVGGRQSIFQRKVLSVLGLRNLSAGNGQVVFAQLRNRLFWGQKKQYPQGEGLNLMEDLTGNTVDLDTCVLRCNKVILSS
jgi:hypothetical protein